MRYFVLYNPTQEFIQKVYRMVDGYLYYWGEQGGWHGSSLGNDISTLTEVDKLEDSWLTYDIPVK